MQEMQARQHNGVFWSQLWRLIRREPLLQLTAAGLLIFMIDAWSDKQSAEAIHISRASVDALVQVREQELSRPLVPQERQQLVDSIVENEILFREALRLGLHHGSDARKLLINKVRYLLREDVPEPSEAELQAFFEQEEAAYSMPERRDLEQVLFRNASSKTLHTAGDELRQGADFKDVGERAVFLPLSFRRASQTELSRFLGEQAAAEIFALPLDVWAGPIRSRHGYHFFRVITIYASAEPDYDQIAPYLRDDWSFRRHHDIIRKKTDALKAGYDISVESQVER